MKPTIFRRGDTAIIVRGNHALVVIRGRVLYNGKMPPGMAVMDFVREYMA